jgi:hypothetical protein
MFDLGKTQTPGATTTAAPMALDAQEVTAWTTVLAQANGPANDAQRIDALRQLEQLKCAAEALQADLAADLDQSRRAAQAAAGVTAERQGRGVAAQVALARRESPHRGQRHLGLAKVLRDELPHTRAAFRAGRITEWKATLIARETACLSREHRQVVDAELAGDPDRLEAMGDGELDAEAKKLAYALDANAFVERRARAEADRRVTLRPAPDVMSQLSALLPVKDGVAVYAALKKAADTAIAAGDDRSRGQIMADTLVERVTTGAGDGTGKDKGVGVMINLVISDRALFGATDEPGWVEGYGPVPVDLARELANADKVWLRRLYTAPTSGELVALDAKSRRFPAGLARLIRLRDRRCRTPWCDAPIRHTDHAQPADEGGETSATNGQGLCEACNHAKQATGWHAMPRPGPRSRHTVETVTPTGHSYPSTAPPVATPTWVEIQPGVWQLAA